MVNPIDPGMTLSLEGQMVLLRRHRPEDFPAHQNILNDAITMQALKPYFKVDYWTDEMIRQRYETFDADPSALMFSVCHKADGSVVGSGGYKNIDLKEHLAEFGLILHRSVWGSGFAVECHLLGLEFGFEEMGLRKIFFKTGSWNGRMRGFFHKYGIPLLTTSPDGWLRFEVSRTQWPEVKARLSSTLSKK